MLAALLAMLSCSGDVPRKRLFFRMDTVTEVTLAVPSGFDVRPVWRAVDSLLLAYEKRFSVTGELSEVRALNEQISSSFGAAGDRGRSPLQIELGEMIRVGLAYGDTLGGAFDITVLPLKELWGFCEQCTGDEPLPDSGQVAAAVRKVGYRQISVNDAGDSATFESPDVRVDIGGIAKGYVLSRLGSLLRDRGVNNFLIAAGGDILASGSKQDGKPWQVGVQHPRNRSELITAIPLKSGALVTSGDYERFRIVDGNRYHHIFDPSAGYPCNTNQSLTVWAADPVRADILSTGLFCRPAPQILEFVRERESLECLIADSTGKIHTSNDKFWFF